MICYRDTSYCSNQDECKTQECSRRLTYSEKERAKKLGLPVAFVCKTNNGTLYLEWPENIEPQEEWTKVSALYPHPTPTDRDAERLDWIAKKFFVCSWNGVVGEGCRQNWRIAGDHRHTTSLMTESTFSDAIDQAMQEGK